jgi:3'-phosphoadenosine 5'-phosphosulfate sulfotransferase (PAPS reductase)/FAD synthetase
MSFAATTFDTTGEKDGMFSWTYRINRPSNPTVDYLIAESHSIIDRAFREHHAVAMIPLYSGGNDSGCSCHVASLHPRFAGTVYTINTRTGAFRTKLHQRKVCKQFGWKQEVRRSKETYEKFVRERGCPGPGRHQWIYQRLKDHVIKAWVQEHKANARPVCLVTGCRKAESTRRLGTAEEIKRGGSVGKDGTIHGPYELWTAPIVHWTSEDKRTYMKHFGIPMNPFSATLGMSLECGCGAFADRQDFGGEADERELIRRYAPDVSKKIDIVERIARESGTHCVWGTRPRDCEASDSEEELPMLCQSCVARSAVTKYS